jgi:hypothetical protein
MSKHAENNKGQQKMIFSMGSAPRLYNGKLQGSRGFLSEVERVQLKNSSFQSIVVEFWRWQSKVIEKK